MLVLKWYLNTLCLVRLFHFIIGKSWLLNTLSSNTPIRHKGHTARFQTMASQALTKRPLDNALMPPPPKRIKRPSQVLDEDEYTEALSQIIARDFFPGLLEARSQQDYLDALESKDSSWISSARQTLTEVVTPGPDGRWLRGKRGISVAQGFGSGEENTPIVWSGDTPTSVVSNATSRTNTDKPHVNTNMALSAFQAKYTSEDNESFYKLLEKKNTKRAERHAWMWNNNKIPTSRQIAHREREQKLLTDSSSKPDALTIEQSDSRKAMPDSWKHVPDNTLMFLPSSVEDTHHTMQQSAEERSRAPPKAIDYDNTRLPTPSKPSAHDAVPPSPSLSAVKDAIAGRPRYSSSDASFVGSTTPRVNGYSFVDSEEPVPPPRKQSHSPPPDDGSSLFGAGDATPNPFNIANRSKREDLHHRMVDKVAKSKRHKAIQVETKTPVPRFASSPRVARGGLTPAAQSLLGKVGGGKTPSLWDSGKTPRRSGLREMLTSAMGK